MLLAPPVAAPVVVCDDCDDEKVCSYDEVPDDSADVSGHIVNRAPVTSARSVCLCVCVGSLVVHDRRPTLIPDYVDELIEGPSGRASEKILWIHCWYSMCLSVNVSNIGSEQRCPGRGIVHTLSLIHI